MTAPLISIIVAIYNSSRTLRQTLDTLVSQTMLHELEIICVDDFSSDDSRGIINEYAAQYAQIVPVFCESNKGTLRARYEGVSVARGQYAMFVDGDDGLEPDACEKLYKLITARKADVLGFGATIIAEDGADPDAVRCVEEDLSNVGRDMRCSGLVRAGFIDRAFTLSHLTKIYKTEIIKKAYRLIPDGHYVFAEDYFITFLVLRYARSYAATGGRYYRYRMGHGISTRVRLTTADIEKFCTSAALTRELKRILQQDGVFEQYAEPWQAFHDTVLSSCVYRWKAYLPKAESSAGFELLLRAWGAEPVCLCLIKNFPGEQKYLAEKIGRPPVLNADARKVKTIGTFYYRMANGGTERVLSTLIDIWCRRGYRVVLFTDRPPEPDEYPLPEQVERVQLPDSFSYKPDILCSRFSALYSAMREKNIDLFIHNAWQSLALLWDMLAVKTAGVPFVEVSHNVFSTMLVEGSSYSMHDFERLVALYSLTDMTVVLSKTNQMFWRSFCPNTRVIANPCHLSASDYAPSPLCGHDVILIGRISPEKRPLDAVEIMGKVIAAVPDARLIVVGKDESRNETFLREIKSRAAELGIEKSVRFEGFQPDCTPYYQTSSVHIATSDFEGYMMVIAESKVFGIPCVMYDMPYLTFRERENEGVIPVEPGDKDAMAAEVIRLLTDDEWRRKCGRQARQSAERFSNDSIGDQWEEIFRVFESQWNTQICPDDAQTIMLKTMLRHALIGADRLHNSALADGARLSSIKGGPLYRLCRTVYHTLRFWRRYGLRATLARVKIVLAQRYS